jgi:hypothetical protein
MVAMMTHTLARQATMRANVGTPAGPTKMRMTFTGCTCEAAIADRLPSPRNLRALRS